MKQLFNYYYKKYYQSEVKYNKEFIMVTLSGNGVQGHLFLWRNAKVEVQLAQWRGNGKGQEKCSSSR